MRISLALMFCMSELVGILAFLPIQIRRACAATRRLAQKQEDVADVFLSQLADNIDKNVPKSLEERNKVLAKSMAGEYDRRAARAKVETMVNENPVLMMSVTTCPFCLKAKSILIDKGACFEAIELNKMGREGHVLRAEMAEMVGRTSVPAIWIGGEFVGGCNDGPMGGLVKLNESGKLDEMLQEVGALHDNQQ